MLSALSSPFFHCFDIQSYRKPFPKKTQFSCVLLHNMLFKVLLFQINVDQLHNPFEWGAPDVPQQPPPQPPPNENPMPPPQHPPNYYAPRRSISTITGPNRRDVDAFYQNNFPEKVCNSNTNIKLVNINIQTCFSMNGTIHQNTQKMH